MKGAEAIIKALEAEGVKIIFGYPGGAMLPFYDALYDSDLVHILTGSSTCSRWICESKWRGWGLRLYLWPWSYKLSYWDSNRLCRFFSSYCFNRASPNKTYWKRCISGD